MARCAISPKKIKKSIRPLVPLRYGISVALVRGGWPHGLALLFLVDHEDENKRITGTVNYLTKEPLELDRGPINTWDGDRKEVA